MNHPSNCRTEDLHSRKLRYGKNPSAFGQQSRRTEVPGSSQVIYYFVVYGIKHLPWCCIMSAHK